eukprot:Skav222594  [mRNA]  locus=scaffold1852:52887:55038:- [translate_table: standard]
MCRQGRERRHAALPLCWALQMWTCRCPGSSKRRSQDINGTARHLKMNLRSVDGAWADPAPMALLIMAMNEEMLYDFFAKVAAVVTVRVVRDTKSLESEQHGYVNFGTFQDAEKVLKTLDGAVLHGRRD